MKNTRRVIAVLIAAAMCVLCFAACGKDATDTNTIDVKSAKTIADLKGAKIAAQTGTFHADARLQIEDVQGSNYPAFDDLLVALQSGAIDGYISEEPTALFATTTDSTLTFLPFKNNDTGFTTSEGDTSIAVGLKKGSELREKINEVIAGITEEQKSQLMEQMATLASGGTVEPLALTSEAPATTNGVLKVAMECNYKPYNWTDVGTPTIGAVPISSEGKDGQYANGYDVQIAQYIANKLGMKLEIYAMEWDSLIPAVQSGTVDAIAAGMSPTAERAKEIDFTTPYYESNLVVIIKK